MFRAINTFIFIRSCSSCWICARLFTWRDLEVMAFSAHLNCNRFEESIADVSCAASIAFCADCCCINCWCRCSSCKKETNVEMHYMHNKINNLINNSNNNVIYHFFFSFESLNLSKRSGVSGGSQCAWSLSPRGFSCLLLKLTQCFVFSSPLFRATLVYFRLSSRLGLFPVNFIIVNFARVICDFFFVINFDNST